jgi:hypothetical protein
MKFVKKRKKDKDTTPLERDNLKNKLLNKLLMLLLLSDDLYKHIFYYTIKVI